MSLIAIIFSVPHVGQYFRDRLLSVRGKEGSLIGSRLVQKVPGQVSGELSAQ